MGHLSRLRILLDELHEPNFKKKLYIQYHDNQCLEIAKRYFNNHAEDIVFFNNSELVDLSELDALIIDSIQKPDLLLNKRENIKLISLSPLYEDNNNVDFVISRGKTNVDNNRVNQIIGSEYSVFNNLPIKNDIDDYRLILHIGGGKYREKILLEIISIFIEKRVLPNYQIIYFGAKLFKELNVINKQFSKFTFSINDIIISSGGLSFSEAANSGIKNINFFINEEHMNVRDASLEAYKNVWNVGTLDQFKKINKSNILNNIQNIHVQKYNKCKGANEIVQKIEEILNE